MANISLGRLLGLCISDAPERPSYKNETNHQGNASGERERTHKSYYTWWSLVVDGVVCMNHSPTHLFRYSSGLN